jgi:hypothetical protein
VCGRPTGHRERLEPIEFVSQFLLCFPGKELLARHRFVDSG